MAKRQSSHHRMYGRVGQLAIGSFGAVVVGGRFGPGRPQVDFYSSNNIRAMAGALRGAPVLIDTDGFRTVLPAAER